MAIYEIKNGVGLIPEGETTIKKEAFYGCDDLKSVEIPASVTSIFAMAFNRCRNLESITIPKNISMIGLEAFSGCGSLTSIVVEEGNFMYDSRNNCNAIIVSATNTLLRGCSNTIIPEGVEKIDSYAFSGCKGLTSIVIPEGVKAIEKWAFFGCENLTSIVIPQSVTEIKEGAFADCKSLTSIVVEEGNPVYDSRNNCNAIIEKGTTLLVGCQNSIIPESITKIGYGAFSGRVGLTNIEIPDSVQEIGAYAFSNCTDLEEIILPENIEYIEQSAFRNSGLTSVVVPEKVRNLHGVFLQCENLKTAVVKGKLEDFRSLDIFPFKDCSALETLTLLECIRYFNKESCNGCKSLKNIYVPAKKGDYYKKRFAEELHPIIVEMEPVKKSKK